MTFVFVHIPKTAGTSFRYALEKTYRGEIMYDYSDPGVATPIIRELIFDSKGPINVRVARVVEHIKERDPLALVGHFPATRYWGHFPAKNFITFVRNPVERALSHYDHHISYGTGGLTLEKFLKGEGTNLQSKLLADVDLSSFGLIGITEHYRDSLRLLEVETGLKIPLLRRNLRRSPWRWLKRKRPPVKRTKELLARVHEVNLDDEKLYQHLLGCFRARFKEAFNRELERL